MRIYTSFKIFNDLVAFASKGHYNIVSNIPKTIIENKEEKKHTFALEIFDPHVHCASKTFQNIC